MRAQRDREEQSVLIGAALGVFAIVFAAEGLGLALLHVAFGIGVGDSALGWAVVIAGAIATTQLVRSERAAARRAVRRD